MFYSPHQSQYLAYLLARKAQGDSLEFLASALVDAQVDLNPHQIDAALFACKNPLSRGVILADEVGLGKTIEAGLVILQRWAERKRRILIVTPASLRKQWQQELLDKFGLRAQIVDADVYKIAQEEGKNPFDSEHPLICSYEFARHKADDVGRIAWDLTVLDEAHRLRGGYKKNNKTFNALTDALAHAASKILLTATPLQNSLLELYSLVGFIDDRVFGDLDSFKEQFSNKPTKTSNDKLRARLVPICQRTLRRQAAGYINYTERKAIVEEFTPSEEEQAFKADLAEYLRRPKLYALPKKSRHLTELIAWKLMASSNYAIAGALGKFIDRLEGKLTEEQLLGDLSEEYEGLENALEEWDDETDEIADETETDDPQAILAETDELKDLQTRAQQLNEDAKIDAFLAGLKKAFDELAKLGAPQKAIVFTEFQRTQDCLYERLLATDYAGENGENLVLFNGSNKDKHSRAIYKDWRENPDNADKVSSSKTADKRAAIVDYFKNRANIMIATEAAAEGINLQFCSLVINYDLPWNPQRVEQRIGRCHRYGQKHDVVVVNFIDRSNAADARVYELLNEKFQLFNGVFGASNEILGAIGTGVDIEKRIANIYKTCRTKAEIEADFKQLQKECAADIDKKTKKAHQTLMEHFDQEVSERLKIRGKEGKDIKSKHTSLLVDFTKQALGAHAVFASDNSYFTLDSLPPHLAQGLPTGRFVLPSPKNQSADPDRVYRVSHPLAQALIEHAINRQCAGAKLTFDYNAHKTHTGKISTLEPYIGQGGQLRLSLLDITTLDRHEQHLIVSAITDAGEILQEYDPEKLLLLPIRAQSETVFATKESLAADHKTRTQAKIDEADKRSDAYYDQEVIKIHAQEDDIKQKYDAQITRKEKEIKKIRKATELERNADEKAKLLITEGRLADERDNLIMKRIEERKDAQECRRKLIEDLQNKRGAIRVEETTLFDIQWRLI